LAINLPLTFSFAPRNEPFSDAAKRRKR
jgi:hypothetical protein